MARAGTRRARQRCQCGAALPQNRPHGQLWYYCETCARRLGVSPYWDGIHKPKRSPTRTPAPRARQSRPASTRAFDSRRLRTLPDTVCLFTATNQEDAERWGTGYLAEMTRMGVPFAVHFDKCQQQTRDLFAAHPLCCGYTCMDDPRVLFHEKHKQALLDLVVTCGYGWAFALDADELFERDAPAKIRPLLASQPPDVTSVAVRYANCWGDCGTIRTNDIGLSYREKAVRIDRGVRLEFRSALTNGPTRLSPGGTRLPYREAKTDTLAVVHLGLMTRELREQHKARWDRIYGAVSADGKNPYGMWRTALDEVNFPPAVAPNPYL